MVTMNSVFLAHISVNFLMQWNNTSEYKRQFNYFHY